jgi:hypothetical protein
LQEDWNDLQTNQRALASAVETAYKAGLPKTRGPGASNASWSYWDKKMKEQDAQFERDDEEDEEEEESDDEEGDFPVKTKSLQKTQTKPSVVC